MKECNYCIKCWRVTCMDQNKIDLPSSWPWHAICVACALSLPNCRDRRWLQSYSNPTWHTLRGVVSQVYLGTVSVGTRMLQPYTLLHWEKAKSHLHYGYCTCQCCHHCKHRIYMFGVQTSHAWSIRFDLPTFLHLVQLAEWEGEGKILSLHLDTIDSLSLIWLACTTQIIHRVHTTVCQIKMKLTCNHSQGRRNALISGQVNIKKGGVWGPPPEKFFRFGALRGGSGDFWTEQAS